MDTKKLHRIQLSECKEQGYAGETEFWSFKEHPELMPLLPNKLMMEDIKSGKWTGIDRIKCGRFGGICSSQHPECRKMRGFND